MWRKKKEKEEALSFKEEVYAGLVPSPGLLGMIREHEGCVLELYKDSVGKSTIGYGHNIEDNGITLRTAESILVEDVRKAMYDVHAVLEDFYPFLSIKRKWVVVDMMFNLGESRFKTFKKFIKALREQDFAEAAREMLDSKWAEQVGKRATNLAKIMRNG